MCGLCSVCRLSCGPHKDTTAHLQSLSEHNQMAVVCLRKRHWWCFLCRGKRRGTETNEKQWEWYQHTGTPERRSVYLCGRRRPRDRAGGVITSTKTNARMWRKLLIISEATSEHWTKSQKIKTWCNRISKHCLRVETIEQFVDRHDKYSFELKLRRIESFCPNT